MLDVQRGLTQVLIETTGANTQQYIHSPRGIHAMNDGSNWSYMLQDGLGSVRAEIAQNVVVNGSQSYAPYGEVFGASGSFASPYGFTGEQTDGNGQVYLRARYYNPSIGVFNALDPDEGMTCTPMSLNGYSYVHGNPIMNTDPTGMTCECDDYLPPSWNFQAYIDCLIRKRDIEFFYNRQASVSEGIRLARIGRNYSGGLPSNLFTGEIEQGVNTNSARFISLALFQGGFPMTTGENDFQGWRAECNNNRIDGNQSWRSHDDLVSYLTNTNDSAFHIVGLGQSNLIHRIQIQDMFPGILSGNTGTRNADRLPEPSVLQEVLNNTRSIRWGDYVFGSTGANRGIHGFLVVGRGPIITCDSEALSGLSGGINPLIFGNSEVPYVVDLYGTQRGTPRPFYCPALRDSQVVGGFFEDITVFTFYKIPDSVIVPADRIFTPNFDKNYRCS